MRALKEIEIDDAVIQEIGRVAVAGEGRLVVSSEGSRFHCRRALSCLVEPEAGDSVLFAGRPSGDLYVLAVLERSDESMVVLRAPGDLTVKVDNGRFAVAAAGGVDIQSGKDISLAAKALEVRASLGRVFVRQLDFVGERIVGEVDAIKTVAARVERCATRVIDRVKRSYRFVEETELLRAGQIEHVARETVRIKGANAFVQADLLVKVDGDQIHLG